MESERNIHSDYENVALSVRICQSQFGQFRSEDFPLEPFPWSG